MPGTRICMRKIKEILRLSHQCGLGKKTIARCCKVSKNTVKEYLQRFSQSGLTYEGISPLDDKSINKKLYPEEQTDIQASLKDSVDFAYIHEELKKKHVTLHLLWVEHKEGNPDGLGRSQFYHWYNQWRQSLDVTMRQMHKAGEKCFVDYCEGPVIQDASGIEQRTYIFVMIWGASNYTYAEVSLSMDQLHFISSHIRSFEFFGCVSHILVPDRCKSAVTGTDYYDPEINRAYQEMATHYQTVVIPARPRKPKDKPKVETAVKIVERKILAALRHKVYTNINDMNEDIKEHLEKLNAAKMQKLDHSRRDLFETLDKPNALPLPETRYEYGEWKKVLVNLDYHIDIEHSYYSVPYTLVNQKVETRIGEKTIEIFHQGIRIASHPRLMTKGESVTDPQHMPVSHQKYLSRTPSDIIDRGYSQGESIGELFKEIFSHTHIEEQAYKICQSIIRLDKVYSPVRLNQACKRALHYQIYTSKGIKDILKNGYDQHPVESDENPLVEKTIRHENVRGSSYYQQAI